MKFKVGQRVWDTAKKEFVTFKKVSEEHSLSTVAVIERDDFLPHLSGLCHYPLHLLHQTADDMFEKVGYEKKLEDSSYIIYNYHNYEGGYITELRIDKEKNKYKLTNFTNNNQAFSAWGDKLLHLAIHQKMIELGYIEL
jgi:hypothetical protein